MPKLDLASIPEANGTGYPGQFAAPFDGRWQRRIGKAAGLTDLGASHVMLEPGAMSSLRHWHEGVDEMLVMLTGEAVLVEDDGETVMTAGDIATWPKGERNGHHLVNRGTEPCSFVAMSAGDSKADRGEYSDIDMTFAEGRFFHKDGSPY